MAEEIIASSTWRGRLIRYAPLILWIGVIFFLSSNQGSMAATSRFIRPIIEFFFPTAALDKFLLVHAFIRKTAHFIEYAVLAIFAARAFFFSWVHWLKRYWYLFSILLVLTIAAIDETNQSTEIARTGSGWDVLLDLVGGIAALSVFYLARRSRVSIPVWVTKIFHGSPAASCLSDSEAKAQSETEISRVLK